MRARTVAHDDLAAPALASGEATSRFNRYLVLTKSRLSGLVVFTTAIGSLVVSPLPLLETIGSATFAFTLLGTALAAAGANALNQVVERDLDRNMRRTRTRPLPAGTMTPRHALITSLALAIAGPTLLWATTNALTAFLALLTIALYVWVYTPLKTRSPLCTMVGAVCGAIPPMMGVTAITGRITIEAWLLFAILFVWQIPHFLALAWYHRDDYARGGFRMLPLVDGNGSKTCVSVLLYSLALVPMGFAATLSGMAGWAFTIGSIALGGWFAHRGWQLYRERNTYRARRVFMASLLYLPVLLLLMVADRGPAAGIIPWERNTMRVVGVTDRVATPVSDRIE
jgi:protoheme IX farnesyltransferase